MAELLTIGEFATATWLSTKALRLYERKGLLIPAETDPFNGYRKYRPAQVDVARLITMLRRVDMSLDQIRDVLRAPTERRAALIAHYRAQDVERHARRQALATFLEHAVAGGSIEGEAQPDVARFEVSVRDVPLQHVLTATRHTTAQELPDVIRVEAERLFGLGEDRGGAAGSMFVIYHGQVGWESDGPIEVCVPINTARAHRDEPPHRELCTGVNAEDVQFPRILAAFEAVRVRVSQLGLTPAGPPREVYIQPEHRPRCEVALPVHDSG